jgi:hypothetical protein
MKGGDRINLAFAIAFVLYATSAGVGYWQIPPNPENRFESLAVVLGVPATASLLFLLVSTLVPSLLGPGRLQFPLTITLPLVYTVMNIVATRMWTTMSSVILELPPVLALATLWHRPATLGIAFTLQILVLTLWAAVKRPSR